MNFRYIEVKIEKVEDINEHSSSGVVKGQKFEGMIAGWPKLGEPIYLYKSERFSLRTILATTKILKIDGNRFYTKNSIYEIKTKADERNDIIDKFLNLNME